MMFHVFALFGFYNLNKPIAAHFSNESCPAIGQNSCVIIKITLAIWEPAFCLFAWSKLRLCSANHRPGYWSYLPCDWPSTAWAYSEQETENRPWSRDFLLHISSAIIERDSRHNMLPAIAKFIVIRKLIIALAKNPVSHWGSKHIDMKKITLSKLIWGADHGLSHMKAKYS